MNTTDEKTRVLCFAASPDQAAKVEELRVKSGKIVSRSEILGELVEIGLKNYERTKVSNEFLDYASKKADVERGTERESPIIVPSVPHTRSSKRNMERSTRKSAGTADSK